jgi:hypothetical protein
MRNATLSACLFLALFITARCPAADDLPESAPSKAPSVEQLLEIEQGIIEGRRTLQAGRVVVTNRTTVRIQHPQGLGVPKTYETYFDGEMIRADYSVGSYKSQTIATPNTFIRTFSDEEMVGVFGRESRPSGTTERPPDPRRLGIVVWFYDTINEHGYEEVLLNPNREKFRVEVRELDGKAIWKVSFRFSSADEHAAHGEYWLSPGEGWQPVHIAIHMGEGDTQMARSITSELSEYGPLGLWYPKKVVFRLSRGSTITNEEIVEVKDAAFGSDVPEQTFALQGLNLPDGKVIRFDGGELGVWDGQRVVRSGERRERPISDVPRLRERVLLLAAAVGLALLGAHLWRRRQGR